VQAQKKGVQQYDFLTSEESALLDVAKKYKDDGFTVEQLAVLEDQESMVTER
jgi:hypothetical protein